MYRQYKKYEHQLWHQLSWSQNTRHCVRSAKHRDQFALSLDKSRCVYQKYRNKGPSSEISNNEWVSLNFGSYLPAFRFTSTLKMHSGCWMAKLIRLSPSCKHLQIHVPLCLIVRLVSWHSVEKEALFQNNSRIRRELGVTRSYLRRLGVERLRACKTCVEQKNLEHAIMCCQLFRRGLTDFLAHFEHWKSISLDTPCSHDQWATNHEIKIQLLHVLLYLCY